MRDPKRIDRIVEIIRMLWKFAPDLRLCQLLCVFGGVSERNVFGIEDSELESVLMKVLHLEILKEHENIK